MATTYMTAEGLQKLKEELQLLESVERPRVIAAIAEARDKGDLSENAEYDAAKEEQGQLESKIALIIVSHSPINKSRGHRYCLTASYRSIGYNAIPITIWRGITPPGHYLLLLVTKWLPLKAILLLELHLPTPPQLCHSMHL